jgi:hypothetical protein
MPAPLVSKTGPQTRLGKSVLMAASLALLAAGAFAVLPGDGTEGKRLQTRIARDVTIPASTPARRGLFNQWMRSSINSIPAGTRRARN